MEVLGSLGAIVAAFFILSLAVETILENFRGVLLLFGIQTLKARKTLEEGMAEAAEFVPAESKEHARFTAFVNLVKARVEKGSDVAAKLEVIAEKLGAAANPQDRNEIIEKSKSFVAQAAAPVKALMETNEQRRVLTLRIISAVVGIAVAWGADLNFLELVEKTGTASQPPMPAPDAVTWRAYLSYLMAGLAAAGGSSFWHDQLDRIRSMKQIGEQLVTIIPAKASSPQPGAKVVSI